MGHAPLKPDDRLDSWKEIAAYLGRDERTAQRWERQVSLPVHRTLGDHGAVFAYKNEVDAWLARQAVAPDLTRHEIPGNGSGTTPQREASIGRRNRWTPVLIVAAVAIVSAMLATFGTVLFYSRPGPALRVTVGDRSVLGWDARGRKSWEYSLPRASYKTEVIPFDFGGSRLFLVRVVGYESPLHSGELDCFTSRGKLLWTFRPAMTLQFGEQVDRGPWAITDASLARGEPGPQIWAAVEDFTWGHAAVWEVDPSDGKGQVRFVNSGGLKQVHAVRSHNREFILAGGYNNEYDMAAVAVLEPNQPFAVSPQTAGTRFACGNCGQGSPAEYFLLPHSELNRVVLNKTPNQVYGISVSPGHVQVSTKELTPDAVGIYDFTTELGILPRSVAYSSGYWSEHRVLERQFRVDHRAEQCPEYLHGVQVRLWTPAAGWSEIHVPYLLKGPIPEQ